MGARLRRFPGVAQEGNERVLASGTAEALPGDFLNRIYGIWWQFQKATLKVLLHVIRVGGPGKREHADGARESENDLGRRSIILCGKGGDRRMSKDFNVCGEKREALVDDVSFAAERAHVAVPAANGVASILDKRWRLRMGPGHLLQLSKRNVDQAEKACASSVALFDHGLPGFKIVGGPLGARSGAVQYKAVHMVDAKMLKRTGHRLRHLDGKSCGGIVRQAMVLAGLIGELGLKK